MVLDGILYSCSMWGLRITMQEQLNFTTHPKKWWVHEFPLVWKASGPWTVFKSSALLPVCCSLNHNTSEIISQSEKVIKVSWSSLIFHGNGPCLSGDAVRTVWDARTWSPLGRAKLPSKEQADSWQENNGFPCRWLRRMSGKGRLPQVGSLAQADWTPCKFHILNLWFFFWWWWVNKREKSCLFGEMTHPCLILNWSWEQSRELYHGPLKPWYLQNIANPQLLCEDQHLMRVLLPGSSLPFL